MLTLIIAIFAAATLSQGLALYYAGRHQGEEYLESRKKRWLIHYIFNGIFWLVLLGLIIWMQFSARRIPVPAYLQFFGAAIALAGSLLSSRSMAVLGLENAMGRRFFFPEENPEIRTSVYSFLNNPMYDGFILMFIGFGMGLGIAENFILAAVSMIFLNAGLASVENHRFRWNIF